MHNRPLPQSNIKPEELYERVKTSHYLSDLQKKTMQELTLAEKLLLALNFTPSQNANCDQIFNEIEKYDAVKLSYLNLMNTLAPSSVQSGANQEDPEDLINSSLGHLQVFSNEALFLIMASSNYSDLITLSKTSKYLKKMVNAFIREYRFPNVIITLPSEKALTWIKHFRTTEKYQTIKRKLMESPDELSDIDVATLALTINDIKQINPHRLDRAIRVFMNECEQFLADHGKEIITINQITNLISSLKVTSLAIKYSLLNEWITRIEQETDSINDPDTVSVLKNQKSLEVKETDLWKSILSLNITGTHHRHYMTMEKYSAEKNFIDLQDSSKDIKELFWKTISELRLSTSKVFCNLAGLIFHAQDTSYFSHNHAGYAIDLHGSNLENANLSSALLTYIILTHANLENADLSSAKLGHAIMENANLENTNLSGASLPSANLKNSTLINCNLNTCHLAFANLEGANLQNIDFTTSELNHANLTRANLTNCDLTKCSIRQTKFKHTLFHNTKFNFESFNLYNTGWCYEDNTSYMVHNAFEKNLQNYFDQNILVNNTLEVSLLHHIKDLTRDTTYEQFAAKHLKSLAVFLNNALALAKAHKYDCFKLSQRIAKVFIDKFSPIEDLDISHLQHIQKMIKQIKKYSIFKNEKHFLNLTVTSKDKTPENITGREMLVNLEKLLHDELNKLEKLSKAENKEKRRFHF